VTIVKAIQRRPVTKIDYNALGRIFIKKILTNDDILAQALDFDATPPTAKHISAAHYYSPYRTPLRFDERHNYGARLLLKRAIAISISTSITLVERVTSLYLESTFYLTGHASPYLPPAIIRILRFQSFR